MSTRPSPRDLDVIAPNLKQRLSGVTSTIIRLVPVQARQIAIAATGPGLPDHVPHIPLSALVTLPRDRWRVWHARRNTEMLLGLVLRHVFRRKLRLLFTTASQRQHSAYTKWLIRQMDGVVAVSRKSAAYLDRPATVILHGIDLDDFTPPADKPALRARLGLDPQATLIGCIGRIRAQKGTDLFVDAMLRLLPDRPGAQAIVLGRATEAHKDFLAGLQSRIAAAGLSDRIHFPDEVPPDQVAAWYQALDLYVAPQRWEGFGLTPLEAMACGVPVVATDVGAFSEQLDPPEIGLLVPRDDLAALTAATDEMLDRDLAAEGAKARAKMEAEFSLTREAEALIAVYRDLLSRP
ncbi:glycosyltransferase family 4 protein [Dinoroseobacter sp. PD6]|uniref:glycosyltransferase family 4 protein n=1 Tax=Dinoroseobacter sp. PD6 TaxID=3028384 RepID=UPI00237B631E|nr:glycosyltransferase family 4 protein [Dinoroseobacter sp. PD6]MDD9717906.1 glycosyltransferase family 4 protein [Dinoroseobacter sp. PD6]